MTIDPEVLGAEIEDSYFERGKGGGDKKKKVFGGVLVSKGEVDGIRGGALKKCGGLERRQKSIIKNPD